MKKHLYTIILILVFIVGLSLLLYPTISDYWNSLHQSKAIATYIEQVADLDKERYQKILDNAYTYNASLLDRKTPYTLTPEQKAEYYALLDPGGLGIMAYVEIPSIGVSLPIYHGTNESVLQKAIGHLEWTSLPVGGESTHCVISGHRGLPSSRLFTDLDKVSEGDIFFIRVLDELLTYKVTKILTVEPTQVQALKIEKGKDLCTLVTCTPYGVNSHRLLVIAERTENPEEASTVHVTADAMQIEPIIVAPVVAIPLLLILLTALLISTRKRR
ncbi:MAG: class C sortase [Clostridia bacterium]|nr:class C sortase [Clostridia bacterium]